MAEMGFDRRIFLQQAALALLTLGINEIGLSSLGDDSWSLPWLKRYYQTLAEPTGRKLGLLVGINQYPNATYLGGCLTDVELQKELLIHRFGFKSQDLLTLEDRQATRENIETAFIEHLIKQAAPGDVVVFHFSGYGSRVKIPELADNDQLEETESQLATYKLVNSLVPVDGILPSKRIPTVNDLLLPTLMSLARSLATDKVTMVLDTSHRSIGGGLKGNMRVRSSPNPPGERSSAEELAVKEKLRLRINSAGELKNDQSPVKGIVLAAARGDGMATEVEWGGFSAGLFTYALTQYLWQATPASKVQLSLRKTAEMVEGAMGLKQIPHQAGGEQQTLFTYYLLPESPSGAEGIITNYENTSNVDLKLLGLPANVLKHYQINSRLTPVSSNTDVQLQITSREGLNAKATVINGTNNDAAIEVGQLVQESIRVLPRNLGLNIALGSELSRIERVDATSAFSSIYYVSSVVNAGEQAADYLLGRVKEAPLAIVDSNGEKQQVAPTPGGYGLFSAGGFPVPYTAGFANEAVKSAVNRLQNKLQTLMSAKLWRLTVNEGSSRLAIRATLEKIEQNSKPLIQRETGRGLLKAIKLLSENEGSPNQLIDGNENPLASLSIGSEIQYRLENYSDIPIYVMLIGLDSGGNTSVWSSNQSSALQDGLIPPKTSLIIPKPDVYLKWRVSGTVGLAEFQLIASVAPFHKTMEVLSFRGYVQGNSEQSIYLREPLEVVQAILEDLQAASAVPAETIGSNSSDVYAMDVNAWATLSFVYQVV